ncbi:hypothetical protein P170DRAFT_80390 [Aspergillus steynii IBT 23096]|uniref:Mid2 domain-containing protein n=1 Tax=Aspergillus steynii IBT 23096 TaxID=1392250 RepID=A0A2I2GF56_9EURO|nr:uncharacterized protein P170DRAFT_80390 [Aspergillus steynii IBT 23096]PLB51491.1 hypothetical protein P170DRAFT_80390 [Aspergillus steynii IBT 23096]
MSWPTLLMLSLQGLFVSQGMAANRTCYFPNGDESNDVPCTSEMNTSCCSEDAICLDNGYCFHLNGSNLSRDSCTDPDWGDDCPQLCEESFYGNTSDYYYTIAFLQSGNNGDLYCCGQPEWDLDLERKTCPGNKDPFTVPIGKAIVGVAALEGLMPTGPDDYNAAQVNVSQVSMEEETSTTTYDSTPTSTGIQTSRTTPTYISEKSDSSGKVTAVGAGVGVPLGVIALASLAWALWLLRQNRNLRKAYALGPDHPKDQFDNQMERGGQSTMMKPLGEHTSRVTDPNGRYSHRVELIETN